MTRLFVTVAIAAVILLPQLGSVLDGYRLHRDVVADLAIRTEIVMPIGLFPHGAIPTPALHTAPMRIAAELGVLAALAWCWLLGYAAWRQRRGPLVWTLAAVAGLSLLDYYFVLASLTPMWYVMISAKGDSDAELV